METTREANARSGSTMCASSTPISKLTSATNGSRLLTIRASPPRARANFRPFVKGLPITATILSSKPNGDHCEEIIRPTYEDAFMLEYRALYDAVVHRKPVKTTPEDGECHNGERRVDATAREDLVIFKMILDAIIKTEGGR